jgi:hypothetical protein
MVPRRFRGSLASLIGAKRKPLELGKPSASESQKTPPEAVPQPVPAPWTNPRSESPGEKELGKT